MYRKKNPEWLRHLDFEIMDLMIIFLSLIIVQMSRGMGTALMTAQYSTYAFTIAAADIIAIFFLHPYKNIIQRGMWQEFTAIMKHFSLLFVLWIVNEYLQHEANMLPRLTVGLTWCLAMLMAWEAHQMRKRWVRRGLMARGKNREFMLITDEKHLENALEQLHIKRFNNIHVGAVNIRGNEVSDETRTSMESQGIVVNVGPDAAIEYLRTHIVDEVIVDRYPDGTDWDGFILQLLGMGLVVHIGLGEAEGNYPNLEVHHYGNKYVLTTNINTAVSWQLNVKRMMDICGALVGLLLAGIASIFVVPAIKLADPGPVIFKQKRVGKNGRVFDFYKFRSMYLDAEARKAELMQHNQMNGLMFKMENDPRIIGAEKGPGKGIGNFIRKTSLDELPQFWNILKGDMSLVGTRPPTQGEYEQYEPHHKIRLSMNPGLTGMWQVSGRSDITDFEEVVRLDTEYIQNWSLGLDIKILLQTVKVVLMGRGSR